MNFNKKHLILMVVLPSLLALPVFAGNAQNNDLISNVEVAGLNTVKPAELFSHLKLKTRGGRYFSRQTAEEDVNKLYATGYFNHVTYTETSDSAGITIVFEVIENPLINTVMFQNNTVLSAPELSKTIGSQPGNIMNLERIKSDIQAIEQAYSQLGFELAKVQSVKLDENNNLIVSISEGNIERITFQGLAANWPDFIILREIKSKTGTVFNTQAIREDRRRIMNLGYFSDMSTPYFSLDPSDNAHVNLTYRMIEKKVNLVEVAVETGDAEAIVNGYCKFLWNHPIIQSDVVSLLTNVQFRQQETGISGSFRYYQPWIGNVLPIAWELQSFTERVLNSEIRKRWGGQTSLTFPVIQDSLLFSTRYVNTMKETDTSLYSVQTLSGILNYYSQDYLQNKERGIYLVSEVERGGNFFNQIQIGNINSLHFSVNAAALWGVSEKAMLGVHGIFESLETDERGDTVQLFLGGSNSVRGFHEGQYSGYRKIVLNAEFRAALGTDVEGVLFADFGAIGQATGNLKNLPVYWGKGFGFRYNTPIAPLRLDIGINDWADLGSWIIHFNIGQMF